MAQSVAQLGASVDEYELHVFELAYLLALMRVETVAALPDAVLFPKDPQVRRKMHAQGEKQLIANGWITPGAVPGTADYQEGLLSLAATIADPRVSLLTRRQSPPRGRADATIYLSDAEVVEVVQVDRQAFRLRRLKDAGDAFRRVRKMVGVLPFSPHAGEQITLDINAFGQLRQQVKDKLHELAIEQATAAGLSPDAATSLVTALATPEHKGVVSALKHRSQKVVDVRVLGFYVLGGETWLTSVADDSSQQVLIEATTTDSFIRRLVDRVASLGA